MICHLSPLYDGTGARAKKTVGSTVTYYIGDHYEIKGGTIYKYIFAANLRVAQIAGSTVSYFQCGRARSCKIQRVGSPSRKAGQPPGSESLEAVW